MEGDRTADGRASAIKRIDEFLGICGLNALQHSPYAFEEWIGSTSWPLFHCPSRCHGLGNRR
jgi:hypothetical protein